MHRMHAPIRVILIWLLVLGVLAIVIQVPDFQKPHNAAGAGVVGPNAITPAQWAAISGAQNLLLSTTSLYPVYLPLVKR